MTLVLAEFGAHSIWDGLVLLMGNPAFLRDPFIVFCLLSWVISAIIAKGLIESGSLFFFGQERKMPWFWSFVLGGFLLFFYFLQNSAGEGD